jgi:hypothetical protein
MNTWKICLFCGRVLPPTRVKHGEKTDDEHIILKWLIDHLGIRGASIRPWQMDAKAKRSFTPATISTLSA